MPPSFVLADVVEMCRMTVELNGAGLYANPALVAEIGRAENARARP